MKYYAASWGMPLRIGSAIFAGLFVITGFAGLAGRGGIPFWTGAGCLGLLLGCALFTIRGYTITADAILIQRLFWSTRLSRNGLCSVTFEPRAMRWSLRAGNGGVFSFSGLYWNKSLGLYRAFVTDTRGTVVLRYIGRTVVVSPCSPEEFARDLVPMHAV